MPLPLRRIRLFLATAAPLALLLVACGPGADVSNVDTEATGESTDTTLVLPSRPTTPGMPTDKEGGTVIAISPTVSLDICELVPVEAAQRITGRELGAPRAVNLAEPLGQKVCTFGAADRSFATVLQVSVVDEGMLPGALAASGYTVERLFAETRALYPTAVTVTGIGDEAFRHGDTLEVLYNGYSLGVSLSLGDSYTSEAAPLETLAAIAALALENLTQG